MYEISKRIKQSCFSERKSLYLRYTKARTIMANPRLPGISENEQALLYAKLNEYNRGRASFPKREEGVYLVVLPRPGKPNYSLWLYSPLPEKQSILYIHDLSPDINESLRWPVQCFITRNVALFSWIIMRKECRVTVTT